MAGPHQLMGTASDDPTFCSSSEDAAPQGAGQALISWLQRLVTRPTRASCVNPHTGQRYQQPHHQWD